MASPRSPTRTSLVFPPGSAKGVYPERSEGPCGTDPIQINDGLDRCAAASAAPPSPTSRRTRAFPSLLPTESPDMKRIASLVLIALSIISAPSHAQRGAAAGRGGNTAPPPLKFQFLG